jgi:hypothetical protein
VRQQGVLLGLVEAMDLVDEEHRARAAQGQALLGLGDECADLGDAAHHRREGGEVGADLGRQQAGEGRLAGARRAPQDDGREVAAGDRTAERAVLADEVLSPTNPVRSRDASGRRRLALEAAEEGGLARVAGGRRAGIAPSYAAPR